MVGDGRAHCTLPRAIVCIRRAVVNRPSRAGGGAEDQSMRPTSWLAAIAITPASVVLMP